MAVLVAKPRRSRRIALIVTTCLVVASCEQAKSVGNTLTTGALQAYDWTSRQVQEIVVGTPADDGTACYAKERVAFYDAVGDVKNAERLQIGAGIVAIGGAAVAVVSDDLATRIVAAGIAAGMVALIAKVEEDRTRIVAVTTTFNDLKDCRVREARQINADVARATISRDAASARLAQTRALLQEDLLVAKDVNEALETRTAAFALTADKVEAEAKVPDAPPRSTAEQQQDQQEIANARAAIQTNQRVLEQQDVALEQAEDLVNRSEGFAALWQRLERQLAQLSGRLVAS